MKLLGYLTAFIRYLSENIFGYSQEKEKHWFQIACLAALFVLGLVLWGQFFNWGDIQYNFHDWAEVNAPRMAFIGDAVRNGKLPLHMPNSSTLRGLTDRFMVIPDVILSPQVVLLAFMSVGTFVMIDVWLLYTCGFLALLWFRRKYSLSLGIFAVLFILFNFNGHIISHYAVGHITWGGYFLFPWLLVLLVKLFEGDKSWKWVAQTSILMFVIFLQGSFHHFIWICLFLFLLGATFWKYTLQIFKALVCAAFLSMVRILPPLLSLGVFDKDFYGGYSYFKYIIEAMIFERLPDAVQPFANFESNLGFWEFDLFVGYMGFAFIMSGIALWIYQMVRKRKLSPLLFPSLILIYLGIGDHYQFLIEFLSIFGAERVTSRMVILPFVMILISITEPIQEWINKHFWVDWLRLASLIPIAYLFYDLSVHIMRWKIPEVYKSFPHWELDLNRAVVSNHSDPQYLALFITGLVLMLLTFVFLGFMVRRENKQKTAIT